MNYWTYSQIKEKVERDLDVQDEIFIQDDELLGYVNEAIDTCEAEIHTIYEDYFLTSANLSLIAGQSEYSLPSDIYANKIRGIIYSNGTDIFPIKRIKDWYKFEKMALLKQYPPSVEYSYFLKNPSASAGIKLILIPAARATDSTSVTVWYLRNANRLTSSSDLCDIPEFTSFVIQYAKCRIQEKEGHPNLTLSLQILEQLRNQMRDTLRDMVPDNENQIEMDTRIYEEMS